jgi:hypothetical protein
MYIHIKGQRKHRKHSGNRAKFRPRGDGGEAGVRGEGGGGGGGSITSSRE